MSLAVPWASIRDEAACYGMHGVLWFVYRDHMIPEQRSSSDIWGAHRVMTALVSHHDCMISWVMTALVSHHNCMIPGVITALVSHHNCMIPGVITALYKIPRSQF